MIPLNLCGHDRKIGSLIIERNGKYFQVGGNIISAGFLDVLIE